jgi:hypothetical protein
LHHTFLTFYCFCDLSSTLAADIAIFGTTTVWDYLIEVKECLPGGEKLVEHIKDIQKTDIGRARAFIRYTTLSSFS